MKICFKSKPRINKANGQINFTLPRKKLPKEMIDKIYKDKPIKFLFDDDE